MLTTKEKMQHAADLIRSQRYESARKILHTIDHPTARLWLKKIDEIQDPSPVKNKPPTDTVSKTVKTSEPKKYKPHDPSIMAGAMMFVFPPLAGISMGLNWRRLGQPQWTGTTIGIFVALIALLIAMLVGLAYSRMHNNQIGVYATFFGIFITIGINWWLIVILLEQQQKAFKAWKDFGDSALLAYRYNFSPKIIQGLLIISVITGLGYLAYGDDVLNPSRPVNSNQASQAQNNINQNASRVYTDGIIEFRYSASMQMDECSISPNYACLISMDSDVAGHPRVSIILVTYPLNEWKTPGDVEEAKRPSYLEGSPNAKLGKIYDLTIAGYDARVRESIEENEDCDLHLRQLYITYRATGYQFTFARTCNPDDFLDTMQNIIDTISFKD